MSVDTRTPRTPSGDRSSGFDDTPALSMVKVPSDPAQIIVNHASFRVQLGASTRGAQLPRVARYSSATEDTARRPAAARRRPVVWTGRSVPDDTGAHRLLQAVRNTSLRHGEEPPGDAGATQVIPRVDVEDLIDATVETPVVGAQRTSDDMTDTGGTRLLPNMRSVGSAYDEPAYEGGEFASAEQRYADSYDFDRDFDRDEASARRRANDPVRQGYYPGRRMNLGVVLLPLRVFLGFISVYAGMGKLCDPVYFDGGKRGSMVKWLNTLHPWEFAEPLRQFALAHPVGAGLSVAFLQVVVGVLTILGLWQRVAAAVGALLSAALIVTVSWKTVPVYDAPDIIYLAAWSPLIIAGAPVYSVDGRLAGSAWRTLGPRAEIWELRRYVLRRGALIAAIVAGLTLLVGSLLGGAVRDADRVVVPGPGEAPRNEVPGSPLPGTPGATRRGVTPSASAAATTSGVASTPSAGAGATTPSTSSGAAGATNTTPAQTQGAAGQAPPQQSSPVQQAPTTSASSSGGSTAGGTSTSSGDASSGATSGGSDKLVGGLLG
ncbi:DoxX family protein [Actinobacteria bacterium OK074]|nr:DoxX family protein [Actinobacteria bacterium OK074]